MQNNPFMLASRALWLPLLVLATACFSPTGSGDPSDSDTASEPATTTSTTGTGTTSPTTLATTTGPSPETTTTTTTGLPETTSTAEPTTFEPPETTTGPDTTTSTATSTGEDVCGDGIVTGFEACDDGNDIDTDDCVDCQYAFCGDGIVHAGVEECDEDGSNCEICMRLHLRVFVTSERVAAKFGGLAGADKQCQQVAESAGLKGTFMAWLSSAEVDAGARLHQSTRPYKRLDGALVAENWFDLVDGTNSNPISIHETGGKVGMDSLCGACPVWTATSPMGVGLDDDCNDWSGGPFQAEVGECSVKDGRWTLGCGLHSCNLTAHLYCVEQGL